MRRPLVVVAVALVAAGCSASRENTATENALRDYVGSSGVSVRHGSCVDMDFEQRGLHLWNCSVIVPKTVLTPEVERRWEVAVDESGSVVDAGPKR